MKKAILAFVLIFFSGSLFSQYYLRGEIKNERGSLLEGVLIHLGSRGNFPYYSGNSGAFGIPSGKIIDTIILQLDGYETLKKAIDTRKMQSLVMRMLPATSMQFKNKLSSVTKNLTPSHLDFMDRGESYSSQIENDFIAADKFSETGFTLNIDQASYSNIRRFINNQMPVPKDAVRIEEMLNYFSLNRDSSNRNSSLFNCHTQLTSCPWNDDNKLLFVQVSAPKLNLDSIAASNLVFLIDVSGSMDNPNRLPLLQSAFKLLVENLREKDTISIVTYGGGVNVLLAGVSGRDKLKINEAIDSLYASGDTPGSDAIRVAYSLAKKSFIPKGNNRVILATDGDFNVGEVTEKAIEDLISAYRQTGIYLTCLGVGVGNYKDSKLELLAKKGNGNFAYIDNVQEARKVLVTEVTKTLYAVANDAYLDINFNAAMVKSYRLIGFDNKKNALSDSATELEGGEIGSGHTMMALFEIVPTKSDSSAQQNPFAVLSLNYKSVKNHQPVKQSFQADYHPVDIYNADAAYRFAAAVCMFGSLLKHSKFARNYDYEEVLHLASTAYNANDKNQKEFMALVTKAMHYYKPPKKKRKTED